MRKETPNSQFPIPNSQLGFTLIELIVAIFIFSLITVAIVSVFVSTMNAYQKAKAIRLVKENAEFAISSIAKDVRMGNIESASRYSKGDRKNYFMVRRNRGGKVCYRITADYLGIQENIPESASTCTLDEEEYKKIIDLSDTDMVFDILLASPSPSGFYSCPSTFDTKTACPADAASASRRGWVEINLNIKARQAGQEMEVDQINVQTIVSSRDYGWEEL